MGYSADIISTDASTNFMNDELFIRAYNEVKKTDTRGYLGSQDIRWRIHTIVWAAKVAENIEGDFVDCGGGFGYFMSSIYEYLNFSSLDKTYYMFDSFSGQDTRYGDINHFESFGDWYQDVLNNHGNKQNLKILKGYLPEKLNDVTIDKISFLSVDLNSVNPEIDCLNILWDKISKGGIIILDDYGFPGCSNQREAHDTFFKSKNRLVYTCPTGQGIVIK